MMSENENRPRGRKRNITGQAAEIKKQDEDLGTGPVGNAGGYQGRPVQQQTKAQNGQRPLNQQHVQDPLNQQNIQPPFNPYHTPRPSNPQGSARPAATQNTQRPDSSQSMPQRPVVHQRPGRTQSTAASSSGTGSARAGASKGGCLPLVILLVVLLLGGGAGLSGLFGGDSGSLQGGDPSSNHSSSASHTGQNAASILENILGGSSSDSGGSSNSAASGIWNQSTDSASSNHSSGSWEQTPVGSASHGSVVQSLLGSGSWYSMFSGADPGVSSSGVRTDSTSLNTRVATGSREKYTLLKGSGKDKATVLIYMCGADLESRNGMATKDLQEMLAASFGNKVNLVIFTGDASQWRNNSISSRVNQIWQVKNRKMVCLEENMGASPMTDPKTLLSFLEYGAKNFRADRYMLILWDHGSGSVTGYGYDEKNQRAGSMSLAGIDSALKASDLRFDFIGFDACLMATVENALMLGKYADYLIASEEAEPGIGWYYTNWLNQLGENTSVSTLEIGKTICDDFTSACKKSCPGQATTLSVVDLAEITHTVPEQLAAFSRSLTDLISGSDYRTVSDARNGSREFAASSRTDMVDLTDLAIKLGNAQGSSLAASVKSAVKYNRSSITDAYGLSIFFPYKKISSVDKAVSTYAAIGLDDSYSDAIRAFASVGAGGQAVSCQNGYQIPSILTGGSGTSYSSGAYGSSDLISSLLSGFLGGSDLEFLSGRQADIESLTEFYSANMFDPSNLAIKNGSLVLPSEQWALVHDIELNIFYDDGKGYIDLGLDPVYEWDESGNLMADTSRAWLSLNGQVTPFYSLGTMDDGETWAALGYIPVLLNGWKAELLVTIDDHGGAITGARWIYDGTDAEPVAKSVTELEKGDRIQLICDYYLYDGTYQSSHILGNPIFIDENGLVLTDLLLPDASKANCTYRLTDIYGQNYWTAPF